MKKSHALIIVSVLALAVAVSGAAFAQDDEKVIKTTTDSRGFETQHTEVDLMIQTAKALMDAKQYEQAAAEFEKVMKKDPSRLDALHNLGTCYKNLEQYDKAATAYARAVRANPQDERLMINLAYYQMRARDIEGATKTYKDLLVIDGDSYEANKGLGYIYDKAGDKEKALKHYQEAVRLRPTDYRTMGSIAGLYSDMGNTEQAMSMYEQLIENSPDDVANDYRSEVGKMYIKQQNFQKSAWLFDELCKAEPDNYTHHYNYGISLYQLKRNQEASAALEKALELKPDYCPTYRMLATTYEATQRYSDAIKTVQAGLGMCDKDKAGLYYEWGRALEGLSRYDEAILKFELAVNDPTFGDAAKKQIKRQHDLIKRAEAMANQ
jgi:tetratricopeptide (TPR) repeat protein